ncbi:SDR family NAD(P)-dependent oxidoreductase [Streptomyces avicenniae]|uniref:SDR family NAD(P)-dependent oxidoreductase n=1 Tax=Streptomyces avicenniae TaxID=500153 RepID=UPI00069A0F28|nr:SDR family NAD(P)-dependent oxidoreductase [Streptomyces avicenniae]
MPQVWFVTGSSRGLGRAIAEEALAGGDLLAATARTPAALDDLVSRHGDRVRPIGLDVTDPAAVRAAIQGTVDAFGRIDVVVNNAGYADLDPVEDIPDDSFRAQMETNFFGVYHVTRAALPFLRAQGGGHIVQIATVGTRVSTPGLAAYQSAKWAVEGFSGVLALETAPFGVKVTVIEPGGLRTDWSGSSMAIADIDEPYRPTVGAMAEQLRAASGKQPGDPAKAARVIREVTRMDDPPLRLMLGADAYEVAGAAERARAESDARHRELAVSIAFDA